MQTIRITTPQNIDIDYEVAGVGERVVARLIDFGIYIAILLMLIIVMAIVDKRMDSTIFNIVIISVFGALFVFYDLGCELWMNGQSIGKRVTKIKVISLDGKRPSFGQYLLRWLFRIIDFTLGFQVAGLICVAVTDKQQRIGDIVAGTTLIRTKPRTLKNHVPFAPVAVDYQPTFAEVTQLNDRDVTLIQEVIKTYVQTGNSMVVYTTAAKIRELLSINKPAEMDDMRFLQTLVKDYTSITAQADAL